MPIPERIGKYLIRGALGTGAMGSVYEGFDASIERRVAIKTILAEHLAAAQSLGAVARFKHEAQAAGRLHSKVTCAGTAPGSCPEAYSAFANNL